MRILQTIKTQHRTIRLAVVLLIMCGVVKPAFAAGIGNFIVGGQVVGSAAKYPFMASVQLDPFGFGRFNHSCGGSLIAERWVLTAAHCVRSSVFGTTYSPEQVGVVIGASDLSSRTGTFILAEEIIVHPNYEISTVRNDIALIRLSSAYAAPLVVLPATDSPIPVVDETSIVTGWGATAENGAGSNQLREVALPVISNAACFPFYPDYFDSRLALCAGGSRAGGQDSCTGDSGGPLLVARDNVYVIAGIISFGAGCARRGVPGVYTRVEAYTDWIKSITTGTLEVGEQLVGEPADNTVITRLGVNSSTVGSILAGEVAYYDVSGARQVNLTSSSGDADLFIIDDANFQAISAELLKCVSENADQVIDSCTVDQSSDGAFAVVFGYKDTQFTISSQSILSNVNTVQPFSNGAGASSSSTTSIGSLSLWFIFFIAIAGQCRRVVNLRFSRR